MTPPIRPKACGVCLLPRGTEEAQAIHLADRTFALTLGTPVRFHLVSSVADTAYAPGELADVSAAAGDFVRLPPIATVVDHGSASGIGSASKPRDIAVQLTTSLTEVGSLEMHCIAVDDPSKRWLLEFQLRRQEPKGEQTTDARNESAPAESHRTDRSHLRRAFARCRFEGSQAPARAA